MPPEVETTAPPEPLFRASKRRKVFRRRDSDEEHQADSKSLSSTEAAILSSLPTSDQPADVHEEHHVEAPRRAQSSKPRRFGVAFSSNSNSQTPNRTLPQHEATSLAPAKEPEASATDEVSARFAPQTGIVVGKYDKQMDAFVEAEMAKIRAGGSAVTRDAVIEQMKSSARGKLSNREATTLGKLQEVELSGTALDARRKNDKSTADAREGGMQLGKNGKPRRKRWRRGSEDLKRDDLVDAILRESKVGMYEEDAPREQGLDEGGDEEAFAAHFEKQFLETDEKRRQPPPPPNKVAKGDKKEVKGPKLGGSRSARAAMHAQDRAVVKR